MDFIVCDYLLGAQRSNFQAPSSASLRRRRRVNVTTPYQEPKNQGHSRRDRKAKAKSSEARARVLPKRYGAGLGIDLESHDLYLLDHGADGGQDFSRGFSACLAVEAAK
jgi:hypothetical protein